jgi:hypothetical protein
VKPADRWMNEKDVSVFIAPQPVTLAVEFDASFALIQLLNQQCGINHAPRHGG